MTRAYIGLGANLGEREAAIGKAVALLGARDGVVVVATSSLRETAPVGYLEQPPFLNGAAADGPVNIKTSATLAARSRLLEPKPARALLSALSDSNDKPCRDR